MPITTAWVTAYCACNLCCGKWSGGPTASGVMPLEGVTLAAPRSIPFGTTVTIEGVGVRVVQDRASRRYDHRFDVYFKSHSDAKKFGKRKVVVKYGHDSR
jgi:3D (Asp-Asp-Asp) domain-containing protein